MKLSTTVNFRKRAKTQGIHRNSSMKEMSKKPSSSQIPPIVHHKPLVRTGISNISLADAKTNKKKLHRPVLSAESWVISTTSGIIIDAFNANEQREIASLTKIMTCIIVIEEINRTRRSFQEYIHIPDSSCNIPGTKAGLMPSDSLKIWDLLHGLMLPSGSDAALALAENIGRGIDNNQISFQK